MSQRSTSAPGDWHPLTITVGSMLQSFASRGSACHVTLNRFCQCSEVSSASARPGVGRHAHGSRSGEVLLPLAILPRYLMVAMAGPGAVIPTKPPARVTGVSRHDGPVKSPHKLSLGA